MNVYAVKGFKKDSTPFTTNVISNSKEVVIEKLENLGYKIDNICLIKENYDIEQQFKTKIE